MAIVEIKAQLTRPVYRTERDALKKRWVPNTGGIPGDLVRNGRPLIVDGRILIADDVELRPEGGKGAFLVLRDPFEGRTRTTRFVLTEEKGRLRLGMEALIRNIDDRLSTFGGWVDRVTSIDDYMRY